MINKKYTTFKQNNVYFIVRKFVRKILQFMQSHKRTGSKLRLSFNCSQQLGDQLNQ